MTNKLSLSSFESYRAPAQVLADDEELRLNVFSSGFASSVIERCIVWICDKLRFEHSIANEKAKIMEDFLAAVRTEKGEKIAALSTRHIQAHAQPPVSFSLNGKGLREIITQIDIQDRAPLPPEPDLENAGTFLSPYNEFLATHPFSDSMQKALTATNRTIDMAFRAQLRTDPSLNTLAEIERNFILAHEQALSPRGMLRFRESLIEDFLTRLEHQSRGDIENSSTPPRSDASPLGRLATLLSNEPLSPDAQRTAILSLSAELENNFQIGGGGNNDARKNFISARLDQFIATGLFEDQLNLLHWINAAHTAEFVEELADDIPEHPGAAVMLRAMLRLGANTDEDGENTQVTHALSASESPIDIATSGESLDGILSLTDIVSEVCITLHEQAADEVFPSDPGIETLLLAYPGAVRRHPEKYPKLTQAIQEALRSALNPDNIAAGVVLEPYEIEDIATSAVTPLIIAEINMQLYDDYRSVHPLNDALVDAAIESDMTTDTPEFTDPKMLDFCVQEEIKAVMRSPMLLTTDELMAMREGLIASVTAYIARNRRTTDT